MWITNNQDSSGIAARPNPVKTGELVTLTATLESDRQVEFSADGIIFAPNFIRIGGNTSIFTHGNFCKYR